MSTVTYELITHMLPDSTGLRRELQGDESLTREEIESVSFLLKLTITLGANTIFKINFPFYPHFKKVLKCKTTYGKTTYDEYIPINSSPMLRLGIDSDIYDLNIFEKISQLYRNNLCDENKCDSNNVEDHVIFDRVIFSESSIRVSHSDEIQGISIETVSNLTFDQKINIVEVFSRLNNEIVMKVAKYL